MSLKLVARRRVGLGKGAGRRIRARGMIPAVLYGDGGANVNLALEPADVKQILQSKSGLNTIFTLEVDGGETVPLARIVQFQKNPIKRTLVHCDLQRLAADKKLSILVPIELTGISAAGKLGAKIRFVTRSVRVSCLPADIPVALVVDQTPLQPTEAIRLGDITPPEGVELVYHDNAPIVVASGIGGIDPDAEVDEEAGDAEEASAD